MLDGSTKTSSLVHMLYQRQDLGILLNHQTTHILQDPQPLGQQPFFLSLFAYYLHIVGVVPLSIARLFAN